jgi:hypothetical protein
MANRKSRNAPKEAKEAEVDESPIMLPSLKIRPLSPMDDIVYVWVFAVIAILASVPILVINLLFGLIAMAFGGLAFLTYLLLVRAYHKDEG